MIPAFGRYRRPACRFSRAGCSIQESHGLCAIGTAFLVLDTIEDSLRTGVFHLDPRWLSFSWQRWCRS